MRKMTTYVAVAACLAGAVAVAGQKPGERTDGRAIYEANCAACHQSDGRGVAGAFPPLAGSEIVEGDPDVVARIVLDGLAGPVRVSGALYNGIMPGWRHVLGDTAVAAVLSYVRTLDGRSPALPVEPSLVARARAATEGRNGRYWHVGQLLAAGSPAVPDSQTVAGAPAPAALCPERDMMGTMGMHGAMRGTRKGTNGARRGMHGGGESGMGMRGAGMGMHGAGMGMRGFCPAAGTGGLPRDTSSQGKR